MTKKKRFGISEAMTRGLSETIHVVENNAGIFRHVVLPLTRIELDPDNPRKLAINLSDVKLGLRSDDPDYQRKTEELERLKELSHTIKSNGVINPIVVYKLGEVYRVVAGERRCLASILAGKQEIDARVFNEKPKGFELKLIQWVENTAREDLTLAERLGNMRDIIAEYNQQQEEQAINASLLKNITGLSLSQASYYLAVIHAPKDILHHIENGAIRNLDKAAVLAGIAQEEVRAQALQACMKGANIKELRAIINQHKTAKKKTPLPVAKQGRPNSKINMGTTLRVEVIKTLIHAVLTQKEYEKYMEIFSQINWVDLRQTTKAFRKLIEILEVEMAL